MLSVSCTPRVLRIYPSEQSTEKLGPQTAMKWGLNLPTVTLPRSVKIWLAITPMTYMAAIPPISQSVLRGRGFPLAGVTVTEGCNPRTSSIIRIWKKE